MTTDTGRSPDGSGYSAEPVPCSTVSAVPVSIPNAFTNADFARVLSKMSANLSRKTAEVAYGMWNPRFCETSAACESVTFFAALETEARHWRQRAAIAMEARRAETPSGSVEDDSAAIAQNKSERGFHV